MRRLRSIAQALDPGAFARQHATALEIERDAAAAHQELTSARRELADLATHLEGVDHCSGDALRRASARARERADFAAVGGARLLSDSILITGAPSRRANMRRLVVGPTVRVSAHRYFGNVSMVSDAPDVRALWAQLETAEAACADDVLRGEPSTILDAGAADVWLSAEEEGRSTLHVALHDTEPTRQTSEWANEVVAIPRCTFHGASRKLRNFGHWMLDYLPHLVALQAAVPEATYLLPEGLTGFHRRTMALLGVDEKRIVFWDGSRRRCGRVVILEGDGRWGGGRPLSPLLQLREALAPPVRPGSRGGRRVYVSRRDAKAHRRWVDNEPAVEALFASRGFEVRCMAGWSLDEQREVFAEADVVAGVSGAGLTDLVFAPPGATVIVLVSDSLMRWYADDGQSRAQWLERARHEGELAALGDSPRFYGHVAALFGQRSHVFVAGDTMPIDTLTSFIDDVFEPRTGERLA